MYNRVIRIVAGALVGAMLFTCDYNVVNAATAGSILPTEGGVLATGEGVSLDDIKAQMARNAAKEKVQNVHASVVKSASSTVALTANVAANVNVSIKAETPASKAVKEAKEAAASGAGVSETGNSISTEAKMIVADNGSTVQNATTVVTETSPEAGTALPVVDTPQPAEADPNAAAEGSENTADADGTVSDNNAAADAEAAPAEGEPSIEVGIEAQGEGEEATLIKTVIAICDGYVYVRETPSEEGEVVGKLYNHSAGEWLDKEGDWYKIESGNVIGYVKGDYVITGQDAVDKAAEVGNRVAVVHTTTLKVREAASLDAAVLGLVPNEDRLTVLEETDEWAKVSIEEGDGWVSKEFVSISTEFPKAESKEEEEARLRKEEADRKAANAAAAKAQKKNAQSANSGGSTSSGGGATYSVSGGGAGSSVANYALQFVGNPYVYGGTSLTNGTDCSGFTMGVYRNFGVSLPHSSGAQRSCGYSVGSIANAQPGDLICYSGHVAIYIGGGQIVHASTAKTGIKVSNAGYRSILDVRRIF